MLRYANRRQPPLANGFLSSLPSTRLFACVRVPGELCDEWRAEQLARHFVVIREGVYYKIRCVRRANKQAAAAARV